MTDLLDYLSRHFLTEARLLTAAALDAPTLHDLQSRRLTPLPSYRLRMDVQCQSFFGLHAEQHALHFYPQETPAWLAAVRELAGEREAFDLFARRHQARLDLLDAAAQPDLHDAWRSFLDGTYGLCTRTGLPEDIAAKEWAAGVIETIVAACGTGQPQAAARARLRGAVDVLDAASSPFAPHERQRASRRRLVEQVRERYGLQ